jgi:hypothetical protein
MDFKHFPDIEGFHVAVKSGEYFGFPTVYYRGKIKLHGTNAGVRIKNGEVAAQSRTQVITPTSDNAGFAKWVESRKDWFLSLPFASKNVSIFGEWCGPGIMKGTAINQIPHKAFAAFAVIEYLEGDVPSDDNAMAITEPAFIEKLFANKPEDVYVLPWCCEPLRVEFGNREQLQGVAEHLNKYVEEIEPCDPWVKATFGVEGTAEGAVYYPMNDTGMGLTKRKWFSDFIFKAKGEKHKVVKTKQAVQVDPEVAASIGEFVTMFVTEPRLEQGLTNTGPADMKNTGAFLKWFCSDVLKESTTELEASNLTWDQVSKAVQIAAREWYKSRAMAIA